MAVRGRLNTAQKALIVIALGAVAYVVGVYLTARSLEHIGGWFATSSNQGLIVTPSSPMDARAAFLVWIVDVGVWLGLSLWLFASPRPPSDTDPD